MTTKATTQPATKAGGSGLVYDPMGDAFQRLVPIMEMTTVPERVQNVWTRSLEQRERRDALHARRRQLDSEHRTAAAAVDAAVRDAQPASDLIATATAIRDELSRVARAEATATATLETHLEQLVEAVRAAPEPELVAWLASALEDVDSLASDFLATIREVSDRIGEYGRRGGLAAWIASGLYGERPRLNGPMWSLDGLDPTQATAELEAVVRMLLSAEAVDGMRRLVELGKAAAEPAPLTREQKRARREALGRPNEDWN